MRTGAVLAALLLGMATAAAAPPVRDPDWPCQQIRMGTLSLGAVWTGPSLDPYQATWSNDAAVAELVRRITQRRLPVAQAVQAIHDFAAAGGHDRLLALAAGVFATLDAERAQVVAGLDRYGRRQKELAGQIRADMATLRSRQAATDAAAQQQVGQLGDQLGWETRLFEQRRQSIAYACDVPNAIEQRLYALMRSIQGALG